MTVSERLQKILAQGGVSSRRHAESLITAGRVRVNGKVVTELGAKADPFSDKIEVDGRRVLREEQIYVLLHKPRGVVSTLSDPEGRPAIDQYVKRLPVRVFPVGRLDFATSGALLLTNDGDFSATLLHPSTGVPKHYIVKVSGEMTPRDVARWEKGVRLEDGMTKPAVVSGVRHEAGKTWFELTITEGRNQQVRRMGDATRFPVMRLARISFAGISSEDLLPGQMRALTSDELKALKKKYGVPKKVRASATEIPRLTAQQRGRQAPRPARLPTDEDLPEATRDASRLHETRPEREGRPPANASRARSSVVSDRGSRSSPHISSRPGARAAAGERPDARKPDPRKPDARRPDTRKPDARKPDPRKPDARKPGRATRGSSRRRR
jgi:23S rRNA pseudouridine2605 synthase